MHPLVKQLKVELQNAKDQDKANEMRAYMKTTQKFYGVQAPKRKSIFLKYHSQYKL